MDNQAFRAGERDFKKGLSALDDGRLQRMKMIDSLSAHYRQSELLMMFDVSRSSYTYHCKVKDKVDRERDRLKAKVISIHQTSRGN